MQCVLLWKNLSYCMMLAGQDISNMGVTIVARDHTRACSCNSVSSITTNTSAETVERSTLLEFNSMSG